jgi:hypothetical protein
MPAVPPHTALCLLCLQACQVLGPGDLSAWKTDHGIVDSDARVDTGLPMEPPDALCSEAWGRVSSAMDDEDTRYFMAGSGSALLFWFEGPTDVCEIGCTVDWVEPYYLTSHDNYTLEEYWLEAPYRLADDERIYAYFYVIPSADDPQGEHGECWVQTSAGRRSFGLQIMET